jgi:drug/metabolite transporter (DMT)-like permease
VFAELIALYSAMGWAGDAVLVRLGTKRSNIMAAMLVSYAVSVGCMAAYVLLTRPLDFFGSPAMGYFLMSGCLQPLFARALYYEGLIRIGVSRAGPLRGAEPLFASLIGVSLLHERPTALVYIGTVLIVASVWLVSRRGSQQSNWRLRDAALPLAAALVSAVSQTLRKQGLKILPDPFIATVTVTSTSLVLFLTFVYTTRRAELLRVKRESLFFFIGAACFAVSAQVTNFVAIGNGDLSVIIPLLNTTPLFTVTFSSLFLRNVETVTPNVMLGAIVMIAGVLCITLR